MEPQPFQFPFLEYFPSLGVLMKTLPSPVYVEYSTLQIPDLTFLKNGKMVVAHQTLRRKHTVSFLGYDQGIMKSTLSGSKPTFVFPVSFGHLLSAQMTRISGTWEHEIIIENYSNTSITWSCRNVNKEDFSDQEPITGFFIGTV